MKRLIPFILIIFFCAPAVSAQTAKVNASPVGKWKFEAPYAPEGFTTGVIEVSITENKYATTISFTGNDYKIPGERVKLEKDTVNFNINIEGSDIAINLKMESDTKMTGKASYTEGEIPLMLTRVIPAE